LIDNQVVKSGNLLEDFNPPFNPPEEIDDPDDLKPPEWQDEAKIPDSDAVKPDDWDEDAPSTIIDENGVKPDTWLDDEPLEIPDPESTKPVDWDDDLDGNWEPPTIPNPKCTNGQCGPWKPRNIPNPSYKGKWSPPLIDNPDYIGPWAPKKIPNPYFFVDNHPHNLEKMGAIGIEIWTMKDGIYFDNFIISYNQNDIDTFTSQTWVKRHEDEDVIKAIEKSKNSPSIFKQLSDFISDNLFLVGGLGAAAVIIIITLFCLPSRKTTNTTQSSDKPDSSNTTPSSKKKKVE